MKELISINRKSPEKAAYLAGLYGELVVLKVKRLFLKPKTRREKALENIINFHEKRV